MRVNELGVDMCTIVGHKIGAPKGVAGGGLISSTFQFNLRRFCH